MFLSVTKLDYCLHPPREYDGDIADHDPLGRSFGHTRGLEKVRRDKAQNGHFCSVTDRSGC
jgi:hypothetical protein